MTLFKQRPHQISAIEVAQMAIEALWSNKLRSALTMLGVIIGISSTIGISSIGQGVQKSTADNIRGLGTDVLQVTPGAAQSGGVSKAQGSVTTLNWEDAQAISWAIAFCYGCCGFFAADGSSGLWREEYLDNSLWHGFKLFSSAEHLPKNGTFF